MSDKKQEIRYRRWCMTVWQNERFPDKKSLAQFITQNNKVKYLIIGLELTKNEKPHYQTYVEFENGRSFSAIKKDFANDAHFTEAKGTAQQNIDYCSKTDSEPLTVGYVNLVNENLSRGDISSNIIELMLSFDYGQTPKLYELIRDYPNFADYIVRNYIVLDKIYDDIKSDKRKYNFAPQQTDFNPDLMPF